MCSTQGHKSLDAFLPWLLSGVKTHVRAHQYTCPFILSSLFYFPCASLSLRVWALLGSLEGLLLIHALGSPPPWICSSTALFQNPTARFVISSNGCSQFMCFSWVSALTLIKAVPPNLTLDNHSFFLVPSGFLEELYSDSPIAFVGQTGLFPLKCSFCTSSSSTTFTVGEGSICLVSGGELCQSTQVSVWIFSLHKERREGWRLTVNLPSWWRNHLYGTERAGNWNQIRGFYFCLSIFLMSSVI